MIFELLNSNENFDDEDEGFFSTVTDAVVRTVRSTGGFIIGEFVVLAVGEFVAVRIRKKDK